MKLRSLVEQSWKSFSYWGLVVATLFFAASLTPSLLPRHHAVQGVLSGIALAVGYGVGVALVWLWIYMELPPPNPKLERTSRLLAAIAVAIVACVFLWRAAVWQNSIRELMEMEPVETAYPFRLGAIAIAIGVLLVAAVRGLRKCWQYLDRQVSKFLPRRVSYVLSAALVIFGVFLFANHVVARLALNFADSVFLQLDKVVGEDVMQPSLPTASGSAASLIPWDTIGQQGKNFLALGPTQKSISEFWGEEAKQPLRVYVGMRTAEEMEERAELALEELKRVGGFDRSLLVVATPTGTGWLDPGAVDSLEYLHRGDTAIVTTQYSYLPSWITILVDPDRSRNSARILFDKIYDYWKTLPHDSRPQLYLHGLSLGSLGSESSTDLFTVFEDPIHGAVWSGPPFPSTEWAGATRNRNPGSPMWLPTFRDGSMLRFTALENAIDQGGTRWGPMRFIYIQHASDPMCFFSTDLAYSRPDWLVGKRGPDVSPYLQWFPIVTFLQTGFDLPMATAVPTGYGHNYAPTSYIDAWIAVTDPPEWDEKKTKRLKEYFVTPK